MKKFIFTLFASLFAGVMMSGQSSEETISWKARTKALENGIHEIVMSGQIAEGYHTYSLAHPLSATTVEFEAADGYTLEGVPYEISKTVDYKGEACFFDMITLGQKVKLTAPKATVKGMVTWISCTDEYCSSPTDWEFSVEITDNTVAADASIASITTDAVKATKEKHGESIWALLIEAILWGFAMLLTPCVFPMVPMTISFFMKGSSSPAAGRFKAFMYGLFIVLLYTVPISVIIIITRLVGGDAVTADIFNWLATHWIPNLIFFAVFMIFAASFFGAFEITLPSKLVNKSDQNSDKGGLAGIFFMALTLVLVSFSCTGPIVGSVLIKSTQGEFWTPMITMLAFSVAFALPFTIFAMFPSLLKKLKSGSWLNSVKVVLGFIEVALGLKFLSVADQTYHWGILDREIYLAIWIVVFTLLGLYLLGKIKFVHDDPQEKPLTVFRLTLVIAVFSFVVYLVPGMWGAPLKALSGYLPPIQTQDFVVYGHADGAVPAATVEYQESATSSKFDLEMPLGLTGYFTIEEGLEAAKAAGKPVFIDITGHGCVNCREMEQRVWSDPKVLNMLRNDFVIVALYVDDKTRLDEEDWVTTESGKVLKDFGRVNSHIVRERFGVNAQPNYTILDTEGNQLVPVRGYDLSVDGFVKFLQSGLDAFKK